MRVISYNLRENHASGELVALTEKNDLDVLCLQEADTSMLPAELDNLTLADSTKRNRLGLAIYYNKQRFSALDTQTFAIKKSMHDHIMRPAHERVIGTRLIDNESQRQLVVSSFHAAPLTALNSLRRAQIRAAHDMLRTMGDGLPTLMVGDYNYPLFQNKLNRAVQETGYDLSLSDRRTYTRYKFFRGHFDFATSIGLRIDSVETLAKGDSDHIPILVKASWLDAPAAAEAELVYPDTQQGDDPSI